MVPTTSEIIDSKCIYDKEGTVPLSTGGQYGPHGECKSASKLCIYGKCVYALLLNTPHKSAPHIEQAAATLTNRFTVINRLLIFWKYIRNIIQI